MSPAPSLLWVCEERRTFPNCWSLSWDWNKGKWLHGTSLQEGVENKYVQGRRQMDKQEGTVTWGRDLWPPASWFYPVSCKFNTEFWILHSNFLLMHPTGDSRCSSGNWLPTNRMGDLVLILALTWLLWLWGNEPVSGSILPLSFLSPSLLSVSQCIFF